jgi:nucleoside-diphosphate-sugar epimerase
MTTPVVGQRQVGITGSSGGLGRALVARLVAEPVRLIGLGRQAPVDPSLFHRFTCDDLTTADWPTVIDGCSVVFHLAAYVHKRPRSVREEALVAAVNHEATARLALACREAGVILIFASTVAVYGSSGRKRYDGDEVVPTTSYAKSKWQAEQAIRREGERGLRFVILRFPLLYGPHGRGNMEIMLRAMLRRRYWPLGDPRTPKSCLSLSDAAEALYLAWDTPAAYGQTFNVVPDETPTLSMIHEAAYAALGLRMPRPGVPRGAALAIAGMLDLAVSPLGVRPGLASKIRTLTEPTEYDGSRLAELTGFRPKTDLRTGLRDMARWMREREETA